MAGPTGTERGASTPGFELGPVDVSLCLAGKHVLESLEKLPLKVFLLVAFYLFHFPLANQNSNHLYTHHS